MKKTSLNSKVGKLLVNLAKKSAVKSANSTCNYWQNQPALPEAVKKLRKS